MEAHEAHHELNEHIGTLHAAIAALEAERDILRQERQALAELVLTVERHAQATLSLCERARSWIAGLTPDGGAPW